MVPLRTRSHGGNRRRLQPQGHPPRVRRFGTQRSRAHREHREERRLPSRQGHGVTMKRVPAHSRRNFLRGLGAGAALSPFLPLLNASGQEMVFPKRLLLFFSPDGTASIDENGAIVDWKPQGTETDFAFHAIHSALEPHKAKIVVPWGMKMSAGGAGQEHAFGMAGLWSGATLHMPSTDANFDGGNGNRTGWGSGPSIDQTIAAAGGPERP